MVPASARHHQKYQMMIVGSLADLILGELFVSAL